MSRRSLGCLCVLFSLHLLAGCASIPGIEVTVSPATAFVAPGQTLQFSVTVRGDVHGVTWAVNGVPGGNPATGTIDTDGNYVAPNAGQNARATVTATSVRDTNRSASASVFIMTPGQVTPTKNPQVALYTISPPASASVSIQFGTDTNYGLTTWTQLAPSGGGPVGIYVAGMRANTPYHMRAVVQFSGGTVVNDSDHIFTTGALPLDQIPPLTTSTTTGMTPQSGLELVNFFNDLPSNKITFAATDLSGNVLWGFNTGRSDLNPIKLLPNGHFLMNFNAQPDGVNSLLQEIDLAGNIIWQMSAADLNQALAAATCPGCNISVTGTHHDFALLPNGHLIVIASENQAIGGVTVTGDVLIDLDQNRKPVWVWSSFDHLDINRHPMQWPDWTHANAVVYSPDDHDLIISLRHQFWILKIDYNDGQGTGNILWRLGYQGDFTLQNGTDPIDWFYAQHDVNVITSNSSGTFGVILFDNGNNRVLDANGDICGTTVPCVSRVPILQVDEASKAATLDWVDNLNPIYSFFGGDARALANGNVEFDECYVAGGADVYEVTKTSPPQTVWHMQIASLPAYRAVRIPSLYPGVQW